MKSHFAIVLSLFILLNGAVISANDRESITVDVNGSYASIFHNQTLRNCGSVFDMQVEIDDNLITLTEVDSGMPAFCECFFDLSVTVGPLGPGEYTVEVHSTDEYYQTYWGSADFTIQGNMMIESFASDCFWTREDSTSLWLEVEEDLMTLHLDDVELNCCLEAQWTGTLDGSIFQVDLQDVGMPCDCMCYFNLSAQFGPFGPGTYTLDFWNGVFGTPTFTIGNGLPQEWEIVSQYQSECFNPQTNCYSDEDCDDGYFCLSPPEDCGMEEGPGLCQEIIPENDCITLWDPVCGCDGVTYSNDCFAITDGQTGIDYYGQCIGTAVWQVDSELGSDELGDGMIIPFATIQHAVNQAGDGDEIRVANGIYAENIDFMGKALSILSDYVDSQDVADIINTVIDGGSNGPVVVFQNGETRLSVIAGFTITNGQSGMGADGAGIRIIGASPTIEYNHIIANSPDNMYQYGGGIYCENGSPMIQRNEIRDNDGFYAGSGIYLTGPSDAEILDNLITGNTTVSGYGFSFGAGIFAAESGCNPIIHGNDIHHNTVDFGIGGGIAASAGAGPQVERNVIYNNVNGGLAAVYGSEFSAVHNTVYGNTSSGVTVSDESYVYILNSIIWGNSGSQIDLNGMGGAGSVSVNYSALPEFWDGPGNITDDPQFVNPGAGDFNLDPGSPCIDAGNPESPPDEDGSPADMGAVTYDHYECEYLEGDFNADGMVDISDFYDVLLQLETFSQPPGYTLACGGDLDGDNLLTINDTPCILLPEQEENSLAERNIVQFQVGDLYLEEMAESFIVDVQVDIPENVTMQGAQFDLVFENWDNLDFLGYNGHAFDDQAVFLVENVSGNRISIIILSEDMYDPALTGYTGSLVQLQFAHLNYDQNTSVSIENIYSQPMCSSLNIPIGFNGNIFVDEEPCPDLSDVDFGPCEMIIGWGWTGEDCNLLSGCGSIGFMDGDSLDYAPWLFGTYGECMTSCDYAIEEDVCLDLSGLDFGDCDMVLGVAWNGTECVSISGCGYTDSNGDYYGDWIYDSIEECEHLCADPVITEDCPELFEGDFGLCDMILGWAWNGEDCHFLSGCSTIHVEDGQDYAQWIYNTYDQCMAVCGSGPAPSVTFSFENYIPEDGTFEIHMDTEAYLINIDLNISGADITDVILGPDQQTVNVYFDEFGHISLTTFLNSFWNPGQHHLCTVSFDALTEPEICMTNAIASQYFGGMIEDVILPECIQPIPPDPVHFTDVLNGQLDEYLDLAETLGIELPIAHVIINSAPDLDIGDEISLMDASGIINFGDCSNQYGPIMVGAGVWTGGPIVIEAFGSLDFCDQDGFQYPGFVEHNDVMIQVWDSSDEWEYPIEISYGTDGLNWGPETIILDDLYLYYPDAASGDVNMDMSVDVLDVVMIINHILGEETFSFVQIQAADINEDGAIDVLDIVGLVNLILAGARNSSDSQTGIGEMDIDIQDGWITIHPDRPLAGVQLKFSGTWQLSDLSLPAHWEHYHSSEQLLLVAMDLTFISGEWTLGHFPGDWELTEIIASDINGNAMQTVLTMLPDEYALHSLYPNPFNPVTNITFRLPEPQQVQLAVYDLNGQQVQELLNSDFPAGTHEISWFAQGFASGVYIIRIRAGEFTAGRKVILMK